MFRRLHLEGSAGASDLLDGTRLREEAVRSGASSAMALIQCIGRLYAQLHVLLDAECFVSTTAVCDHLLQGFPWLESALR